MEEGRPPGRMEEEKARRPWLAEKGRLVWQAAAIRKANSLDDDTAATLGQDILDAAHWRLGDFPDPDLLEEIESDMRKHSSALAGSPGTAAYLESRLPGAPAMFGALAIAATKPESPYVERLGQIKLPRLFIADLKRIFRKYGGPSPGRFSTSGSFVRFVQETEHQFGLQPSTGDEIRNALWPRKTAGGRKRAGVG